jgi:N utilization substance protein A
VRHKGFLDALEVSRADAEGMIMAARVKLGWIEPPVEAPDGAEEAAEAETEAHPT